MFSTDLLVLLWLRQKRVWPPQYPPPATVLSLASGNLSPVLPPREEWGAQEWCDYALFLERNGADLTKDLIRIEHELIKARRRLSRSNHSLKMGANLTVLSLAAQRIPKTRGRKPSRKRMKIAAEVMAIRAELEVSSGKRVTDKMALGEYFNRQGMRQSRTNENRNILNAMSELRGIHNISKR